MNKTVQSCLLWDCYWSHTLYDIKSVSVLMCGAALLLQVRTFWTVLAYWAVSWDILCHSFIQAPWSVPVRHCAAPQSPPVTTTAPSTAPWKLDSATRVPATKLPFGRYFVVFNSELNTHTLSLSLSLSLNTGLNWGQITGQFPIVLQIQIGSFK